MTTVYKQAPQHHHTDTTVLCDQDALRTTFALTMSVMYKNEVPLYADLVDIVQEVNRNVIEASAKDESPVTQKWNLEEERLDLERHGAIRLGSPYELATVRRIFNLIGLHPVGYYDLSVANLPMHATAFRPVSQKSLAINPFRVFTTLLRPELLEPSARELALSLIQRRRIFSDELLRLIELGENQGGFRPEEGQVFVAEAMKTFRWQPVAAASLEEYEKLRAEHPILADIACFSTAHINHLTPRTLDIDAAQTLMKAKGLKVKSRIEGPPQRKVAILLRQTSFLALEESIKFPSENQDNAAGLSLMDGSHKARFGEIEQRGIAVTHKGRKLYDDILSEAMNAAKIQNMSPEATDQKAEQVFQRYPDDWDELVSEDLVYYIYYVTGDARSLLGNMGSTTTVTYLTSKGVLGRRPQTYEDFLPFSAAGIFQSNLKSHDDEDAKQSLLGSQSQGDRSAFEEALATKILDADDYYLQAQNQSLIDCRKELGIEVTGEMQHI
jgi:uncharacterized glyoxalase superfamily metalloenzyme YdcJ